MMKSRTLPVRRALLVVLSYGLASSVLMMRGCGRQAAPTPTTADVKPSAPVPVGDVGAKPTETEAKQFAQELIAAIGAKDIARFNALVDWDALFERVTRAVDVPDNWKREFQKGFLDSLTKPAGIFTQFARDHETGGEFTLLHVHEVGGQPRALIRVVGANMGVNYLDFELARRPGGKVRAIDFYPFASGELMSATIRRPFLQLAAAQSRNIFDKLLTSESEMVKTLPRIQELASAIVQGQPKQALAIYDALPASVKNEKTVMLLRYRAAQALDDNTMYLAAMDDLTKTFPNDPSVDLTSIDAFFLRKEFDKALAGVDRLEKSVGGDPYLNSFRASILVTQGNHAEAAKLAQAAVDAEPTLRHAHFMRLGVANLERRFGDMVKCLGEFQARFGTNIPTLETQPEYAAFVASPEYKKYKNTNSPK